jgi:Protein of unknown function (DUF2914)/Tetratricopeptide repeat
MDAVEQAANAGNYAAAEPLLREAALLQEASLGPLHPDLANTLNNLAVVCELTGKMADAEHFYRRAYAVASTALAPDDDLVATSERNLRDFCETQGLPLELPKQTPIVAPEREVPVAAPAPVPIARPSPDVSPPPVLSPPSVVGQLSPSHSARPLPVRLLSAAALLLVTLIAAYFWFRTDAPGSSSTLSPAPVEANPMPLPPFEPVTPTPVPPAAPPAASSSIAAPKSPAPRAAPPLVTPAVVEAQLCRGLSRGGTWRCEPASSPVDPGRLFFFTRLKAASNTTVHHRWYRGDRLVQTIDLRIQASTSNGFRTYSQNTVNAGTGDWRVELTAANGAVLHELRFVVRQ